MTIDIGPGQAWADRRGADRHFQHLTRYITDLTIAEFTLTIRSLQESLTASTYRVRLDHEFNLLKSIPPRVIRRLLTYPVWIYWARSVQELLRARSNPSDIVPFWRGHLSTRASTPDDYLHESVAHFSQLVLAACMLAGKEIELEIPIDESSAYLSLAGTGFSYAIPEQMRQREIIPLIVAVQSVGDGIFSLRIGPAQQPVAEIPYRIQGNWLNPELPAPCWLTQVTIGAFRFEIDNHDSRFVNNWVSDGIYQQASSVRPCDDSAMSIWHQRLVEALELLKKCCSPLDEEILTILRSIVPVVLQETFSISCSSRDYWGAIQCSLHPGIAMADVLAHEYRHNILNAILEVDPVIDETNPAHLLLYSPWRLDPRPPIGLLHGIYAFTEVVGCYHSYLEDFGPTAQEAKLAEIQILTNIYRLQTATHEFSQHVKLTPFGMELFEGIQQRVDKLTQESGALDNTLVSDSQNRVRQHREAWLAKNR